MTPMTEGVYALQYARRPDAVRGEHFYGYSPDCHDTSPLDYFVWAICRPDDVVLLDAGFTREVGERRARPYLTDPVDLLALIGRRPEEVSTLAISHLHYDHTGHIGAFPEAEVLLQRAEYDFWTGPFGRRGVYGHLQEPDDIDGVTRLLDDGRARLLDGDAPIDATIGLHHVGGHTPGLQVMSVQTAGGPVVLAADASHLYENIEADKPFAIVTDLPGMYASFDRLNELAGADGVVVPGHDPRVRDRHEVLPGRGGLVTRLDRH